MASISVPCPKCSVARPGGPSRRPGLVSLRSVPLQLAKERRCTSLKAAPEAVIESINSAPKSSTELEAPVADVEEVQSSSPAVSDAHVNAFLAEVSELVKLVHSRDIVELQLKQADCEIIIRKKEALPQPPSPAPFVMMQGPPQTIYSPQPPLPVPSTSTDVASKPAAPPALPPPRTASSSLPTVKSPMAGTFYRAPGPGEPPFVKEGDKVQKGQVLCIIEAMKLMNEIEADTDGTVVEVLAENGKPVSVDTPLFSIRP